MGSSIDADIVMDIEISVSRPSSLAVEEEMAATTDAAGDGEWRRRQGGRRCDAISKGCDIDDGEGGAANKLADASLVGTMRTTRVDVDSMPR